jgi:hypothetical protein
METEKCKPLPGRGASVIFLFFLLEFVVVASSILDR